MNKRGHVLNAVLLSAGLAVLLAGETGVPSLRAFLVVGVPVTLGALFPDVDTAFGTHRKTFHVHSTATRFRLEPKSGRALNRCIRDGRHTSNLIVEGDQREIRFVGQCLQNIFSQLIVNVL